MVFNTHTNCPHVDTLKLHTHTHIHTTLFHILLLFFFKKFFLYRECVIPP